MRLCGALLDLALLSADTEEAQRISGFVSAAATEPSLMVMLTLGLTMLSMSRDQECLGMDSCRPETVTYTAISSCQSVRRTTCCGLIAHNEQMYWVTSHSIEAEGKLIGLVLRRTGL